MRWEDYVGGSISDKSYRVYWLANHIGNGGNWCVRTPQNVPLKATYTTIEEAKIAAEEHYETLRGLFS
jgi:hypothetical protein